MDTEFINAFVNRQRENLNDLLQKCIMLEARLTLAEEKLSKQPAAAPVDTSVVDDLQAKLSEVKAERDKLRAQVSSLEQRLDLAGQ